MPEPVQNLKVLFCCTGVGICHRGIESFFREAFDGLKYFRGLDCWLIKGAGARTDHEIPVWCLPRTGRPAHWLGRLFGRTSYAAEQWTSFFPVVSQIRRLRPNIIFYSDANLGFQLFFRRNWIGTPYQLLFSNGGPIRPPFDRTDFVHQVAPFYHKEALEYGEPPGRHFMVPYGIHVPPPPVCDPCAKRSLRLLLDLPTDKPVVLSVGAINRSHKRVHYVVEEIARLPEPRPFLQMLGMPDGESPGIIELANQLLGPANFAVHSVPYPGVFDYYKAADVFVLGSLQEGFGRVYIEALMHGVPVIAHRHPVMEYVLGGQGVLGHLERPGELARLLSRELLRGHHDAAIHARWQNVQDRFSWPVLSPQYSRMFHRVSNK